MDIFAVDVIEELLVSIKYINYCGNPSAHNVLWVPNSRLVDVQ